MQGPPIHEPQRKLLGQRPPESFWGRLKTAGAWTEFAASEQAKHAVIWTDFYNHRGLHASLGHFRPMKYEQRWCEALRKKAA